MKYKVLTFQEVVNQSTIFNLIMSIIKLRNIIGSEVFFDVTAMRLNIMSRDFY